MAPLLLAFLALDPGGAARDLLRSVTAALSHEPAAVTVRNQSSLGPAELAEIRHLFADLKSPSPTANVQITVSENLTQFLLVAEIQRSSGQKVLIESWPRSQPPAATAQRVTLAKTLLWEQDTPILDAAQSGPRIVVLDPSRVSVITAPDKQTAPIPATHPWPRDPRARLSLSGAIFSAWLPAAICRGTLQPLTIECQESSEPWLIAPGALAAFVPQADYFSGRLDLAAGPREIPPFYTAAPIGDGWIFAGADHQTRIYNSAWAPAAEITGWGSDLAAIETPCGPRVLATRASTAASGTGETDAITVYEITEGTARLAGPPIEFTGPVTALWSAGSTATAVARDLETGRYAAYSLSPACDH